MAKALFDGRPRFDDATNALRLQNQLLTVKKVVCFEGGDVDVVLQAQLIMHLAVKAFRYRVSANYEQIARDADLEVLGLETSDAIVKIPDEILAVGDAFVQHLNRSYLVLIQLDSRLVPVEVSQHRSSSGLYTAWQIGDHLTAPVHLPSHDDLEAIVDAFKPKLFLGVAKLWP